MNANINYDEIPDTSAVQELEDLILRNHELAAITESYRKALAVSKQLADSKVKPLSTGICFAAQLDGRGRLLENVMGEVGCLGLDYDHLSSETMGILFELIRHSPPRPHRLPHHQRQWAAHHRGLSAT